MRVIDPLTIPWLATNSSVEWLRMSTIAWPMVTTSMDLADTAADDNRGGSSLGSRDPRGLRPLPAAPHGDPVAVRADDRTRSRRRHVRGVRVRRGRCPRT